MSVCDCSPQQVKKNKEDSVVLANHAREMMFKLVDALQVRNDLDSTKPSIEDYYRKVPLFQIQNRDLECAIELLKISLRPQRSERTGLSSNGYV
jgi:hypothetical protein